MTVTSDPVPVLADFLPQAEADIAATDGLAGRVRAEISARLATVAELEAKSAQLRWSRDYMTANPGATMDDVRAELDRLDAAVPPAQAEVQRCERELAAADRQLLDAEAVLAFLRAQLPHAVSE